jgi:hypothetical protein
MLTDELKENIAKITNELREAVAESIKNEKISGAVKEHKKHLNQWEAQRDQSWTSAVEAERKLSQLVQEKYHESQDLESEAKKKSVKLCESVLKDVLTENPVLKSENKTALVESISLYKKPEERDEICLKSSIYKSIDSLIENVQSVCQNNLLKIFEQRIGNIKQHRIFSYNENTQKAILEKKAQLGKKRMVESAIQNSKEREETMKNVKNVINNSSPNESVREMFESVIVGKPNQINEGVITERIDPSVARLNESRELRSRLAKNIDQANTADQGILSETDAKSISYESERKSNVLNSIGLTPERWKFLAGIKD